MDLYGTWLEHDFLDRIYTDLLGIFEHPTNINLFFETNSV